MDGDAGICSGESAAMERMWLQDDDSYPRIVLSVCRYIDASAANDGYGELLVSLPTLTDLPNLIYGDTASERTVKPGGASLEADMKVFFCGTGSLRQGRCSAALYLGLYENHVALLTLNSPGAIEVEQIALTVEEVDKHLAKLTRELE